MEHERRHEIGSDARATFDFRCAVCGGLDVDCTCDDDEDGIGLGGYGGYDAFDDDAKPKKGKPAPGSNGSSDSATEPSLASSLLPVMQDKQKVAMATLEFEREKFEYQKSVEKEEKDEKKKQERERWELEKKERLANIERGEKNMEVMMAMIGALRDKN